MGPSLLILSFVTRARFGLSQVYQRLNLDLFLLKVSWKSNKWLRILIEWNCIQLIHESKVWNCWSSSTTEEALQSLVAIWPELNSTGSDWKLDDVDVDDEPVVSRSMPAPRSDPAPSNDNKRDHWLINFRHFNSCGVSPKGKWIWP